MYMVLKLCQLQTLTPIISGLAKQNGLKNFRTFKHFYEILGLQKTSYISKISTPFRVKMVKWVYLDNYKAEVKFSTRTQLPRLGAIWHIGMSGTLYAADLGSIIDGL